MTRIKSLFRNYGFSLILIGSIITGSVLGAFLKERAVAVKPLGDIFLNLLFTVVVPLVFFSIASAVAAMTSAERLKRILAWMMGIFVVTGIISSSLMFFCVTIYPPAQGVGVALKPAAQAEQVDLGQQIVRAFTTPDFSDILSKKNMLALIVFAILVGLAAASVREKGKAFTDFLVAGNEVMTRVISYVMLYAPVGLGAYFAYLVGVFGPKLFGSYLRVIVLYYPVALAYFFAAFSCYAWFAGGIKGVKMFWTNIIPTSLTAWATGSSVATIPTNIAAARRIGIPKDIHEVVIPIGATIHMEGSCLAAIVKIAFLFGIFGLPFTGVDVIAKAILVAILCGTVISGIPAGGMLGELLIITMYGFPLEAMPLISMIGTLVDPPATMVNSVGDNVSSMMIARIMNGKKWMEQSSG